MPDNRPAPEEALEAYRSLEPRRGRDPFSDRALAGEISRIAEERRRDAAGGWWPAAVRWFGAAPRGALATAALSLALLVGIGPLQLVSTGGSVARMEAGADALASNLVPQATEMVTANGEDPASDEASESEVAQLVSGAALLLLVGSLLVAIVSVRRRRA